MSNPVLDSVYGYYQVGDQVYLNKTEALYQATQRNLPVKWHFHEEVFSTIDWTHRPAGTLRDLYRERAQQIRDNYDHVIINFSGGMDSYTVLHSFISNNIHVDEVVTRFPNKAERKLQPVSTDRYQGNMGSEYELACYPVLKYIEKFHPEINVVFDDISECIEQELTVDDYLVSHSWQTLLSFSKFTRQTEQELRAIEQNKRVAVVTGAEKTHVLSQDGIFYGFFQDQSNGGEVPGRTTEFFYWNKHFPLIPVLQAHCLKDFIVQDMSANPSKIYTPDDIRSVYHQACYPDYDIGTFQTDKIIGTWPWPSDRWIKKYNSKFVDSWSWVTSQYFNSIDQKYIKQIKGQGPVGFQFQRSPYYKVADNTGLPDFVL